MYQIAYNGKAVYDPRDDELRVADPKCNLGVSQAGTLSFRLPPTHPFNAKIARMSGTLELISDGQTIYRGRVTRDDSDFLKFQQIESEGALTYLNDSVIPPFDFPAEFGEIQGNAVEVFFRWILEQHNAQVLPERRLLPGTVTVTDPNNYIHRSAEKYNTSFEILRDRLFRSSLGGHILVRYEPEGTYLDYLADLPLTNVQPVEFGSNLMDLLVENDATEVYTIIMPIGSDGLLISDLPDRQLGSDFVKVGSVIECTSGIAKYGRITRVVNFEDVTVDTNLQAKALEELAANGVPLKGTVSCKACDLAGKEPDMAPFSVGRYTLLASRPHGINSSFPLMELSPDILNPANTIITLSQVSKTLTGINHDNAVSNQVQLDNQQQQINKNIQSIGELTESFTQQITQITQSTEAIIMQAMSGTVERSEFELYQETISSQLAILAGEITMTFNQTIENITEVNGELQRQIEQQNRYIRGTAEGILVGDPDNATLLRLDAGLVEMLRNNVPSLFIDEKGVNTDAIWTNSIYLGGNVGIFARDGVLTVRRVGG